MGRDMHFNQCIAGCAAAEAGTPLASEPQHLTVFDPCRYRDVEPLFGGERQSLLAASRRRDEIDGQREMPIGAARPEARSRLAASPAARGAVRREQILEIAQIHLAFGLVSPPLGAFGMPSIIAARRTLGAGFVDFTAVVARPLIGIGEQIVGGRDRLEARFRFGFAGVQIRVKLFGELAIDFPDLVRAGVGFDAEHLIGCLRHLRYLRHPASALPRALSLRGGRGPFDANRHVALHAPALHGQLDLVTDP